MKCARIVFAGRWLIQKVIINKAETGGNGFSRPFSSKPVMKFKIEKERTHLP